MRQVQITVLTPTFNRAELLKKAYASLQRQTSFDFEWIIVDDGSTDNTDEVVKSFQNDHFDVFCLKQENGGKHRALNHGLKYAKGFLTLILDSDDELTEDCIAFCISHIPEIEPEKYAGLSGLRGWKGKNSAIGALTENDSFIDASNIERKHYGLEGDKAEVYKTALLQKYPFPEFEGEKFLRESAVWDQIALNGYQIRWYQKIIYLCEYLEGGLTKSCTNATYVKNFQGFTYCTQLALQCYHSLRRFGILGSYYAVAKEKGLCMKEVCKTLGTTRAELLLSELLLSIRNVLKGK